MPLSACPLRSCNQPLGRNDFSETSEEHGKEANESTDDAQELSENSEDENISELEQAVQKMMGYSKAPDELCLPTIKRARSRSLHPLQHYQRCRQTQNCHYEKYLRRGRHLCQKLNHLPPPLLGDLGAEQWR